MASRRSHSVELATLAKYPFLLEASAFIRSEKVSLEEILLEPAYARADPWQGAGARRPRARPGIGARRHRDRGPAGATPRLPRRADPRVCDRRHVLGSAVRASRGDRRRTAPRIGVRRPHPASRIGTRHGFAAPGRWFPTPFHGLPPIHEHDAGCALEADQSARGPWVCDVASGEGAPRHAERDPAAHRGGPPVAGQRRHPRGVQGRPRGNPRRPRGEEGDVQGRGHRQSQHHPIPTVHVQPLGPDPEPRERAPYGALRDRRVPAPHRAGERGNLSGLRRCARLRGRCDEISDRTYHRDLEPDRVHPSGVLDDEVLRHLPWARSNLPDDQASPAILPRQGAGAAAAGRERLYGDLAEKPRHVETPRWTAVRFPRTAKSTRTHSSGWNATGAIPQTTFPAGETMS